MSSLVSFLGRGKYQEVRYRWKGDVSKPTKFIISAVLELFRREGEKIEKVFLLLTREAEASLSNSPEDKRALEENVKSLTSNKIIYVSIPSLEDHEALWRLFYDISGTFSLSGEVIIDVTHAFRVLPLVATTTAIYMKHLNNLQIKHILYGAFEAKKEDIAPIWDLKLMVELTDWLEGEKVFKRLGDLSLLADTLESVGLYELGNTLRRLNDAINLCQVLDIMRLSSALKSFNLESYSSWLPEPSIDVLEKVLSEVKNMAYEASEKLTKDNLKAQLNILRFYRDKKFYSLFFLLAREILLNLLIVFRRDRGRWLEESYRRDFENELPITLEAVKGDLELKDLASLWNTLRSDYRNLIAHAQMTKRSVKPQDIESVMDEVLRALKRAIYSRRLKSI